MLQFGVRAEGLKELLDTGIPSFKGDLSFSDFQAILNVVSVLYNYDFEATAELCCDVSAMCCAVPFSASKLGNSAQ